MMNTPPPEALDPRVRRFARDATAEMTCAQAAEVLGPPYSMRTMMRLCRNHRIECNAPVGANGSVTKAGVGIKMRWTITKAALLSFIVKTTHGPREAVLQAIAQDCPAWLAFARSVAGGVTPAELPANVIPMKGRSKATRRAGADDSQQPDLFAQQQSA